MTQDPSRSAKQPSESVAPSLGLSRTLCRHAVAVALVAAGIQWIQVTTGADAWHRLVLFFFGPLRLALLAILAVAWLGSWEPARMRSVESLLWGALLWAVFLLVGLCVSATGMTFGYLMFLTEPGDTLREGLYWADRNFVWYQFDAGPVAALSGGLAAGTLASGRRCGAALVVGWVGASAVATLLPSLLVSPAPPVYGPRTLTSSLMQFLVLPIVALPLACWLTKPRTGDALVGAPGGAE